jgi:hypothetical protein
MVLIPFPAIKHGAYHPGKAGAVHLEITGKCTAQIFGFLAVLDMLMAVIKTVLPVIVSCRTLILTQNRKGGVRSLIVTFDVDLLSILKI